VVVGGLCCCWRRLVVACSTRNTSSTQASHGCVVHPGQSSSKSHAAQTSTHPPSSPKWAAFEACERLTSRAWVSRHNATYRCTQCRYTSSCGGMCHLLLHGAAVVGGWWRRAQAAGPAGVEPVGAGLGGVALEGAGLKVVAPVAVVPSVAVPTAVATPAHDNTRTQCHAGRLPTWLLLAAPAPHLCCCSGIRCLLCYCLLNGGDLSLKPGELLVQVRHTSRWWCCTEGMERAQLSRRGGAPRAPYILRVRV
jgi:hypothetical protein